MSVFLVAINHRNTHHTANALYHLKNSDLIFNTLRANDHHAPIISMLTAGEVTLFEGKKELKSFTIKGGTLECNHNKVVILAD